MSPEKLIDEFTSRIRTAAAANLECIVLYGSAVAGDFHPPVSNLNILCVLRDSSFNKLELLAPDIRWWDSQKQPTPLFMTRDELQRSLDVFTIEFMDIQQHHRVLFGDDLIAALDIPTRHHRMQVEYELREKLVLLRRRMLLASGIDKRMCDLLLHSAPSFVTLFRHALIALGLPAIDDGREAIKALAIHVGFDPSAMTTVLDARAGVVKIADVGELFARYLVTIEQVTAAVDKALDPNP